MSDRGSWDLSGKVCLVTGSTRGIGSAICQRLARLDANIAANDILPEDARETVEFLKKLEPGEGQVRYYQADVSNPLDVEKMIHSVIIDWGKIDILVNNAGITGPSRPITELTEEEWDRVIAVDLKGTFLVTRAVLPDMISRDYGRVVNLSSIAGKEGNPNMAAYCAAKHGVLGFTKAVAKEVLQYNIRINAVCPALIKTPLLEGLSDEQVALLVSKIPLGRLGKAEEVADMVVFLVASEASGFITGQGLNITGGRADF